MVTTALISLQKIARHGGASLIYRASSRTARDTDPVSKTRQIPSYFRVNGGSPGFHFPLPTPVFLLWVEWEVNKGGTWEKRLEKGPFAVPGTCLCSRTPVIWSCADPWIVSRLFWSWCVCVHTSAGAQRGTRSSEAELQALLSSLPLALSWTWILSKSCLYLLSAALPASFLKMPVELHSGDKRL